MFNFALIALSGLQRYKISVYYLSRLNQLFKSVGIFMFALNAITLVFMLGEIAVVSLTVDPHLDSAIDFFESSLTKNRNRLRRGKNRSHQTKQYHLFTKDPLLALWLVGL